MNAWGTVDAYQRCYKKWVPEMSSCASLAGANAKMLPRPPSGPSPQASPRPSPLPSPRPSPQSQRIRRTSFDAAAVGDGPLAQGSAHSFVRSRRGSRTGNLPGV